MRSLDAQRSQPRPEAKAGPTSALVAGDHPPPLTADRLVEKRRELARRRSGAVDISLLWHPETNRVELAVLDLATDATFRLEVAPVDAVDAFHHPYAYAAQRARSARRAGTRPTTGRE